MFLLMSIPYLSTSNITPVTVTGQKISRSPELSKDFHSAKSSLLELVDNDHLEQLNETQLMKIINITEELIVHANITLQSLLSKISITKEAMQNASANHTALKTAREQAEDDLLNSEVYKNKTLAEDAERAANTSFVTARDNYTNWKRQWDTREHDEDLEQLEKIKELVEQLIQATAEPTEAMPPQVDVEPTEPSE